MILYNYIAPTNPNNVGENGNPIVTESHSAVACDEVSKSFFVVTDDAVSRDYAKMLVDLGSLVAGDETNLMNSI